MPVHLWTLPVTLPIWVDWASGLQLVYRPNVLVGHSTSGCASCQSFAKDPRAGYTGIVLTACIDDS
ncbi:MAG: hypothetical protein EBV45_15445, partial [Chloroflexi bacterium]|nr:hypothetical protein [Chloroflexota bacterium]